MNDIESRPLDMRTDLLLNATKRSLGTFEQVWQSMSLGELEEATGLAKESLEEALRALRGIDGRDDSRIAYGAGRVVLGTAWRLQCRDLPNDPGPDRP